MCLESERHALLQFKQGLVDSTALASWKSEKDCCKWRGITCNLQTGHVTSLNFSFCYDPYFNSTEAPLRGAISPSLLELRYLSYLDLSFNDFGGMTIPKFIGSLGQLKELRLAEANFGGPIPPQLGNLSNLQSIDLSSNDFEGTMIPKFIGSLSQLKELRLAEANFSAPLPPQLRNLSNLHTLDLSGNDYEGMVIPKFICSLGRLKELRLADANFGGLVPPQLGNISNLHSLDLSGNTIISLENLEWLSRLSSLRYLEMSSLDFSKVVNWPRSLTKLTSLRELLLSDCELPHVNLRSLSSINSSTSLQVIDLSVNLLNSSIFHWITNVSSNLVHLDLSSNSLEVPIPNVTTSMLSLATLDLSFNHLKGPIPDVIANMLSLATIDLSFNQLRGGIPKNFQNLCSLESLVLSDNDFSGNFQDSIESLSCAQNTLENLSLFQNRFWGPLPDLKLFSKLRTLRLSYNSINGSLPESVGQLSCLEILDLFGCSLSGVITESHFLNLSRLQTMDLSGNRFSINLSSGWNPPFQLNSLDMSYCEVGPAFPQWILKQKSLKDLSLSNAGVSGLLPNESWDLFLGLHSLDLSLNQIHGELPNLSKTRLEFLNLSSNLLYGAVPSFSPGITELDLSNNMFSELRSCLYAMSDIPDLFYLDLSRNLLSGELPSCWMKFQELQALNLGKNKLSGRIPSWLGNLTGLGSLSLSGNNFSGELPSLENCTGLEFVDLGDNNLSGKIPTWIGQSLTELWLLRLHANNFSGELPSLENCFRLEIVDFGDNKLSGNIPTWIGQSLTNLVVLRLRSNKFNGIIPMSLCGLATIHVLDISHNSISGGLPHCFNNISVLATGWSVPTDFTVDVMWKGIEMEFGENLDGMRSIDMSSNFLIGEIPQSISSMTELISLNLSRNYLNGKLPGNFGNMKMLESLDLSRNRISGKIPTSFSSLNYLGVLDVSHNQLSGRIPLGTQLQSFNASTYMGTRR